MANLPPSRAGQRQAEHSLLPACSPWSRRDLLRVGALGLAGSMLDEATLSRAQAAEALKPARATSVIYLVMMGGVTHIDSFDPKPEASEEIRGTLSPIATRLPGVYFTQAMPHLARSLDKFTLVRSYSHTNNDHLMAQAYALSGRAVPASQIKTEPNIGSIVSYLYGPRQNLPAYIAVPGITRPGPPPTNLFGGGWLGGQYDPFSAGGEPTGPYFSSIEQSDNPSAGVAEDLRPKTLELLAGLDIERLRRRGKLRSAIDAQLRRAEDEELFDAVDGQYQNALGLLGSARVREAFDIGQEPDSLRDRYGRTKIGGRALLARRLVEAGARFVMVDYGYDPDYGNLFDQHNVPGQHFPHTSEMAMRGYHCAGLDKAFAALIGDLDERGLLDSTLVVFTTEFGRTPKINTNGGRDHWAPAGSIFFAGGGVRRGQVIGATDKQGAYPTGPGYSPADVAATVYDALGISTRVRLHDRQGRPLFVLPEGEPIPGLFG